MPLQPNYLNSVNHYENFPVGSLLLPRKIRSKIIPFYNFARTADDIADSNFLNSEKKIMLLNMFEDEITQSANCRKAKDSMEMQVKLISKKLVTVLEDFQINPHSVCELLNAFRLDSQFRPFCTWSELLKYCSYSANPVGRFLLAIVGLDTKVSFDKKVELIRLSDKICTGLQLINFAQDIKEDTENNRCYVPKCGWPKPLNEANLTNICTLTQENKNRLVQELLKEGEQNLLAGMDLPKKVRKSNLQHAIRFSLEIALIIECGKNIVKQIKQNPSSVWSRAPVLEIKKLPIFLYNAILNI
tara:strand:- start:2229 stop:3131 length:903 start_codon:yes stop_codon:yes gene_type:complete